jgi:histidinol-phosphatase
LIALTHVEHGPVVGVISAPALQRRWWAAQGLGAFANGRKCQVSEVDSLAAAQVSITYNSGWDRLGLTSTLVEIQSEAQRPRGFGDFWQHCLVAEGSVDLAIDAVGVAPYDIAALKILVEEAGGTFTDRHGDPTHLGDTAISSNGHLHEQVISRLTHSEDL